MKVNDFVLIVRRHLALLIVATLLGGMGALGAALLLPKSYTSQSKLFVSVATSGAPSELETASAFVQERIQTYIDMASSRTVLEPVIGDLDLATTPDKLSKSVRASNKEGTVLITIEATQPTRVGAADLAGEVADSLVQKIEVLESSKDESKSQIRLVVADPAVEPLEADGMPWWAAMLLGLPVGLALGLAIAMLENAVDNKVRTRSDVERATDLSALVSIPLEPRAQMLSEGGNDFGPRAEAFRKLRTHLRFAQINDDSRLVMVTSALAQEGKTMTCLELAASLAQAGQKVVLVDADLRRPSIAERLGLEESVGLTTALVGSVDVAEALQPCGPDLFHVLTSGVIPPNPTELLESRAMVQLIAELQSEFDTVILDAPPVLPVSDSLAIGKQVGRILFVAAAGESKIYESRQAVGELRVLGVPLSLILNKMPMKSSEMSYQRSYQPVVSTSSPRSSAAFPDVMSEADSGSPDDAVAQLSELTTTAELAIVNSETEVSVARRNDVASRRAALQRERKTDVDHYSNS